MDPCQNNVPLCDPNMCINTQCAPTKAAVCKKECSNNNEPKVAPAPGKYADCCTVSPIVPTPLLQPCNPNERNACGQLKSDECKQKPANTVVLANYCPPPVQPKAAPAATSSDCYPTPTSAVIQVNPCETQKSADKSCVTVFDCANCDLTDYGREFAENTGKMVTHCQCVKFNGLQDSCRHPGCGGKHNCMDGKCSPAQKWKCNFICKNKKKSDNNCDD